MAMSDNNAYLGHSLSGIERLRSERTLLCLLRGCQGLITVVELRNETVVAGRLLNCDGWMNLVLDNATIKKVNGCTENFSVVHVMGTNIRYVVIPDEIDIRKTIEEQLGRIGKTRETGSQHGKTRKREPNANSVSLGQASTQDRGSSRGRGVVRGRRFSRGRGHTQYIDNVHKTPAQDREGGETIEAPSYSQASTSIQPLHIQTTSNFQKTRAAEVKDSSKARQNKGEQSSKGLSLPHTESSLS